jgi:predicted GTPase
VANRAESLYFSDSRRLENALRRAADFSGTPIAFQVTARKGVRKGARKDGGHARKPRKAG